MKVMKVYGGAASDRQLSEISRDLDRGDLLVWPTDTLYGVACDALNPKAVEKLCRLKGLNPDKTNLSIVCSSISQAAEYARIENRAFSMMKEMTPGPYTFLLRASSKLPKAFKGRRVVGVRIPDDKVCLAIAERFGRPLLTTSIEYEDEDYGTNPDLIAEAYEGKAEMMVDDGPRGLEPSTIIDFTEGEGTVLRPGKGEAPTLE